MSNTPNDADLDLFEHADENSSRGETPELPLTQLPPSTRRRNAGGAPAATITVAPPTSLEQPVVQPPAEILPPEPTKKPVSLKAMRKAKPTAPPMDEATPPPATIATPTPVVVPEPPAMIVTPTPVVVPEPPATIATPTPVVVPKPPATITTPTPVVVPEPPAVATPAPESRVMARLHPHPLRFTGHAGHHPPSRGQLLQEARVRCDLGIEQIAQSTKIKLQFLEALEQDDADRLPPEVYVRAYVRRLCHQYGLDEEEVFALAVAPPSKPEDKAIPAEILQHLEEGKQVNPQEERKIRNLTWGAVAIIVLILLAGVGLYWQSQRETVPENLATEAPRESGPVSSGVDQAGGAVSLAEELVRRSPPAAPMVMSELPLPVGR